MTPTNLFALILPWKPGELFEVWGVLITLTISFLILYFFGQYWQK